MEKVLILGGTKFVGRLLVEALIQDSAFEVYLFNRGETNPDLFPTAIKIIGNRETDDIKKISDYNWDYVVDFSSFYPKSLIDTIESLHKSVKKYIYISSISTYDFATYDASFEIEEDFELVNYTKEEALDSSMNTYGKRKAACEKVLNSYKWLNTIILRPSIIYGKYDFTDRFYYWLFKVKNNKKIVLPEAGKQQLSLTYSGDLVNILLEAIKGEIPNGVYNCSTHDPITLRDIVNIISNELSTNIEAVDIPQKYLIEKEVKPQWDIPLWFGRSLMFSNHKIRKVLKNEFIPFRESVKETLDFYAQSNWKAPTVGLGKEKEVEIIEKYLGSTI